MTKFQRSLSNQKISLQDTLIEDPGGRKYDHAKSIATLAVGIGIGLVLFAAVRACDKQPQPAVKAVSITTTFDRMTSHVPATTVRVIIVNSKYPKTLTAIAAVETGKRGHTRTRGDNKASKGIFQQQDKHWKHLTGPVSDDLETQVRQADRVFDALVMEHGYYGAVKAWNGKGKQAEKYRNRVFARLERMK